MNMIKILPKNERITVDQYHNTEAYKKSRKEYALFRRLGLLLPYDSSDIDYSQITWHPSNYASYKELEEDRDRARNIYYKTEQIPEELANKLYITYQEELEYNKNNDKLESI